MYSQHHIEATAAETILGNFEKASTTFQFFSSLFLVLNPKYSEERTPPVGGRGVGSWRMGLQTALVLLTFPFSSFSLFWLIQSCKWLRSQRGPSAPAWGTPISPFFNWSHSDHKQRKNKSKKKQKRKTTVNKSTKDNI